jgi:hypothetical protein
MEILKDSLFELQCILIKKEKKIFLIYMEIKKGAVTRYI